MSAFLRAALAEYKKHKNCRCNACETARQWLKFKDKEGWGWHEDDERLKAFIIEPELSLSVLGE